MGAYSWRSFTVKENNDVEGLPTTVGNPESKDFVANSHEVMIQRIISAGGIIFGKTNLPIDAMDLQSYNSIYGSTSNPWDLSRTLVVLVEVPVPH